MSVDPQSRSTSSYEDPTPSKHLPDDDFFASFRCKSSHSSGTASANNAGCGSSQSVIARPTGRRPSSSPSTGYTDSEHASCADRARPSSSPLPSRNIHGIQRMSATCAQHVRTGQAVLDAAAVVKELVENALDAGATRIEIRLKGKAATDRIIVADNGTGIHAQNFETMCAPRSTSKLLSFSDLDSIQTYGFRGEALSAIAFLAESVVVTTRTVSDEVARMLKYQNDGLLASSSPASRSVGTTVQVDNLFMRLPVRLQEAQKHSTRDLARCLSVVQEYAIISTHVRFELRVGADARLLTHPRPGALMQSDDAVHSNIAIVLGKAQADAMIPCSKAPLFVFKEVFQNERESGDNLAVGEGVRTNLSSKANSNFYESTAACDLRGFVSKTNYGGAGGGGRLSGSWQFFYVNGRPVDMPRVARAINESFRKAALSSNASPACVLNFSLPPGTYDVNLSPDKRQVMILGEDMLIGALKAHLEATWIPQDQQIMAQIFQSSDVSRGVATKRKEILLVKPYNPSISNQIKPIVCGNEDERAKPVSIGGNPNSALDSELQMSKDDRTSAVEKPRRLAGSVARRKRLIDQASSSCDVGTNHDIDAIAVPNVLSRQGQVPSLGQKSSLTKICSNAQVKTTVVPKIACSDHTIMQNVIVDSDLVCKQSKVQLGVITYDYNHVVSLRAKRALTALRQAGYRAQGNILPEKPVEQSGKGFMHSLGCGEQVSTVCSQVDDQDRAETELKRAFKQEWFSKLQVIGQFNLCFIICLLDSTDVFIVDQHASDEKHNFELLERTTALDTQMLLRPLALNLAAEDELLVIENRDRFLLGGFDIECRDQNPPTERLFLRSQPSSKSTMFVLDDLHDIIASLRKAGGYSHRRVTALRPSRVRAMLASRACKKSIKFGMALNVGQMERVLKNLSVLEHPWTCPHGRPTMRHLVELKTVQ